MLKSTLEAKFLLWIAAGLVVLFLCPIWFRASSCHAPPLSDEMNHEENGGPIDNGEHPKNYQYRTSYLDEDISNALSVVTQKQNTKSEKAGTRAGNNDIEGLFSDLLCDVHITDIAVVYFTYCLVIVGWFAMRSRERTSKDLERAYVFIDYELLMERNTHLKEDGIINKQIALVFKNFGRTPAIVNGGNRKCRYWPKMNLPERGTAGNKIPGGIAIGSGSPQVFTAFFEGTECDRNEATNGEGTIYLCGELTYLDMLGEQRETVFCCEWNCAEAQFFMAPNTKLNYHT
jgi:hypothetical protein